MNGASFKPPSFTFVCKPSGVMAAANASRNAANFANRLIPRTRLCTFRSEETSVPRSRGQCEELINRPKTDQVAALTFFLSMATDKNAIKRGYVAWTRLYQTSTVPENDNDITYDDCKVDKSGDLANGQP